MADHNAHGMPARIDSQASHLSSPGRSMGLRYLKPKVSPDNVSLQSEVPNANRKQPRSHKGCVTCKQRRIKCDETKPACQQCSRRKVVCGGYVQRIKWIDAGMPNHASAASSPNNMSAQLFSAEASETVTSQARASVKSNPRMGERFCASQAAQPDITDTEMTSIKVNTSEREVTDRPSKPPLNSVQFVASEKDPCLADESNPSLIHCNPRAEPFHIAPWRPYCQAYPYSQTMESTTTNLSILYQQPQFSAASPENIALLYHRQASDILSIRDPEATNPWQTCIWPLAQNNKALYHALAAMTCLYMSKTQPGLRMHGVIHAQESLELLASDIESGSLCVEAAIASSLALGFGDTFDHKAGSTSFRHTVGVKLLLQQLLSEQQQPTTPQEDMDILCFLAGNWMYMDVIARFTSENDVRPPDYNLWNTCVSMQRSFATYQLDPLMGCAISLFPDLGRVADLVRRVRSTDSANESVEIVSAAMQIRARIEQWTPTISLSIVTQYSSNIPDALQTAEAYRWAALLLLRQSVPQLPWLMSVHEMAQKILMLLATVSHRSRTVVIQILPLTIAGCEATDAEDRNWVRERWLAMSRRMLTGIVDKCLQVTEEVWTRRDLDAQDESLHLKSTTNSLGSDYSTPFTVKSKLHWIQVMKEWNWEVMLG